MPAVSRLGRSTIGPAASRRGARASLGLIGESLKLILVGGTLVTAACSGGSGTAMSSGGATGRGSGGSSQSGGSTGSGGHASGGNSGSGGALGSGGQTSSGGAAASGGVTGSGGSASVRQMCSNAGRSGLRMPISCDAKTRSKAEATDGSCDDHAAMWLAFVLVNA